MAYDERRGSYSVTAGPVTSDTMLDKQRLGCPGSHPVSQKANKPRSLCPQRWEVGYTSATVIVTVKALKLPSRLVGAADPRTVCVRGGAATSSCDGATMADPKMLRVRLGISEIDSYNMLFYSHYLRYNEPDSSRRWGRASRWQQSGWRRMPGPPPAGRPWS